MRFVFITLWLPLCGFALFVGYHAVLDCAHVPRCLLSSPQKAGMLKELMDDENTVIVDVRTPGEFACASKQHVPGAVNMPLGFLETTLPDADKKKRYVLYCVGGYRSAISCSMFHKFGLNAVDVRGGFIPVIRPALVAEGILPPL